VSARADSAVKPYACVMMGALPPFTGHVITASVHHVLRKAIAEADRWCGAIYELGCRPAWPYSFGVIDRRDGTPVYMTDTTERTLIHGDPNQRRQRGTRGR
jgi:hypothetical protein